LQLRGTSYSHRPNSPCSHPPQIRRARLEQLRQQQQGTGSNNGGASAGTSDDAQQQRDREAEMRASLLSQILTPEAADRLGRIRLVKESRATSVENRLIVLARSGQLQGKVSEDQLKQLLGAVAEHEDQEQKVTVSRRKGWDDDDLDDLLDDT